MNDDDGFTRMFRDHYEAVLRYAWRRVGPADAADVAAETFRIAWERRDRLPDDDPRPWLYATARNVALNLVRRDRRRDGLLDALAGDLARRDGEGDHAAAVAVAARQTALAALAGLGERERELVMLVCWEGLDLKGAAAAAGCSRTAAAMRLHRARRRLRHLLGDTPDDTAPP
ncbi:RNA polymerase sigma factor, partial [Actinomadura kijaniata]|uniref:RNA polymerase sigma factor n=1 Tax=Actinomadura kijaniata TaxID=46161 RepID=UPI003F1A5F7B